MRRLTTLILALILTLVWTLPALATSLTDAQKQKNSIDSKINSLNKQKQQVINSKNKLEKDKKNIANVQEQENKVYQQKLNELSSINTEIEKYEGALKESEENYNKQQELLKTRVKAMYENSNNLSYIQTLVESKNIIDFLGRLELIARISKRDNEIIKSISIAKEDLELKKKFKEEVMAEARKEANTLREGITKLNVSRADVENEIKKKETELKRLERQEDELLRQSGEIGNLIRSLQGGGTKYAGGSMCWPVPSSGKVSSYYGMRLHPIFKTYKMHTGVDIHASSGVSILAANKGTVISAGWQNGYGYAVIIDHGGGISTLYAHCSRLLVSRGDKVSTGEVIAKVGSTGYSTGPHLHFEVRKNGATTNPLSYVSP